MEEQEQNLGDQMRTAFAAGKKMTVTTRGGEPSEITIRPMFVDQALELIDDIEKIYSIMQSKASPAGDVDLFAVFKAAKEEVLTIIAKLIERDRPFIGLMELDDLLVVAETIFQQNKDFFEERVMPTVQRVVASLGQASLTP